MKRVFIVLLFLSIASLLGAQPVPVSEVALQEINEQYEYFFWEPVAKAKSYEIDIEKYSPEDDIWRSYISETTSECEIEILFMPGIYRVSIVSKNILGRKGKPSSWVSFKILEESIPYLFDDFLPLNSYYNAPVLLLDKNMKASGNVFIPSADDNSSNTFVIKGKNIFSPSTQVYLVPQENSSDGGNEFFNYSHRRQSEKLEIVTRNSKKSEIVVSYNPEKLFAGYYSLEVVNAGNAKADIDILVLENSDVKVEPDSGFEINDNYQVNAVKFSDGGEFNVNVKASGVDSSASFYLEPSEGYFEYAFDTGNFNKRVELEVLDFDVSDNYGTINLSGNAGDIASGYYRLIAETKNDKKSAFLFLAEKNFNADYSKDVDKFKSKYNKKSEYIDFSLNDSRLSSLFSYTLVSEYDKKSGMNYKIPLSFYSNGKKLSAQLVPEDIEYFGKYALIAENEYESDVIFCSVDNRFRLSTENLSQKEIKDLFFRPVSEDGNVFTGDEDYTSIVYKDYDYEIKKRLPYLFSTLSVDLGFINGSDTYINLAFDIFHTSFVSITGGYQYSIYGEFSSEGAFSTLRFQIPSDYFSPYVAIGAGHNFMRGNDLAKFPKATSKVDLTDDFYAIGQAGVVLFTVLDVKYNVFVHNVKFNLNEKPVHTYNVSVGFVFPFRDFRFKRKVLTKTAIVTTSNIADGTKIYGSKNNAPKEPVVDVETRENISVTGFENNKTLESIELSETIKNILENAFRNCKNLQEVTFNETYFQNKYNLKNDQDSNGLEIYEGAFAQDVNIKEIVLPERTVSIHKTAFQGWTSGQIIRLSWRSSDNTKRNLDGLNDTDATIIYSDGEYYNKNTINPFLDIGNLCEINYILPKNVSLLYEDEYVLGLRYKGNSFTDFSMDQENFDKIKTGEPLLDYLKKGNQIKFKIQGDGNKYLFVIATEDGGYFYYKIKTKKNKVINVDISYKNMKKCKFSEVKKLDINKINMCSFVPMPKKVNVDASFFEFEVK